MPTRHPELEVFEMGVYFSDSRLSAQDFSALRPPSDRVLGQWHTKQALHPSFRQVTLSPALLRSFSLASCKSG
jgi:hypothetical protein